jgi:hypothetical protein
MDAYMEDGHTGTNSGDNAFDGDTSAYGATGSVSWGGMWESPTASPTHVIARIWSSPKKTIGCRIVIPAGVLFNNVPKYFRIQYLTTGTDPNNDTNWITISDYSTSDQSYNIYAAEEFGYEYTWAAQNCSGIRLSNLSCVGGSGYSVRIAELCIFEEQNPAGSGWQLVSGVNDRLRLAVEFPTGVPTYRVFDIGNVGPTKSSQTIVDAINAKIYGYEMEAVRGPFGHIWLQGTPNGVNSYFQADTVANGSTMNTWVGLPSSPTQQQGVDVPVTKASGDAMTITYRQSIYTTV